MLISAAHVAVLLITACLVLLTCSTLFLSTYAWWSPDHRSTTGYPDILPANEHSFSLIMPCRTEREEVMRATLARLLQQTHSRVEVIISVGDDDPDTVAIAHALAKEHPDSVRVSVDSNAVKNKPRQLNTALKLCRNDIVGIFDAESIAAPNLLAHIDSVFQHRNADVVQGAVQLVNFSDSWYSLRNCLEYFIWFRSRLHAHAKSGFIPLGGNTVFVKRDLLVSVGGWDGDCLAEDCDLGVRLSVLKRRIVVAYSPDLVTREETPDSLASLIRQRTRWSLGFMQVYAKGDWRRMPTGIQRVNAWWTLTQQHFMALAGVLIPISIMLALFAKFPLPITMATFLPLIPTFALFTLEICMLHEFGKDHSFRIRARDYLRLVLGAPAYQVLLAISAIRALGKFYTGDFRWDKTAHNGAHLNLAEVRLADAR